MDISALSILLLIISVNMIFVISEIALLTSSINKLKKYANNGSSGAKKAIQLLQNPNKMLSSIQVGITLMSMIIGLYGGNSMGGGLADLLSNVPYVDAILGEYKEITAIIIAIIAITYITVLSEIVPKRIAMLYPEQISIFVAYFIQCFIIIAYPFVSLLTYSVQKALKIMRISEITNQHVSLDEIRIAIKQAQNSGSIQKREANMLQRLIDTGNLLVNSIMTPRNRVIFLDISRDIKENKEKIRKHKFSVFPVINKNFGNLIGMAPAVYLENDNISNRKIDEIAKSYKILYIPETAKVNNIIDIFSGKNIKTAVVVDEYGEFEGLITMHDILKTFLGNLGENSKINKGKEYIQKINDRKYRVSGLALVTDLLAIIDKQGILNASLNKRNRTIGSFISHNLNGVPKVGDSFEIDGVIFKVMKVDGFRVDQATVSIK